ncbi:alpha/beta fold hydrolase [Dictyobacter arantiisoli]|uniref:AB hydrolase-1 domain-containing protein n=1 Tax=Dictyobacter arantiisoli TaxID=2014874 RepID=A0A5A5TE89_9CHLR|nr:alpha/beta hydrolase [Dictyobacter arantiisoli]GCF09871.1 hypothetical protein KDI_34350 [Dictyobacter arantiisoli]
MSSWSDGKVQANGINLHYHHTGGDKPPVVLLHGFTDSGLCWTPIAKALEADYKLIMPDARGHGLSDDPRTGFTMDLLISDVVALINTLQLGKVTLLGHSMGAHTAARVAELHPELVRSVLLEDPTWRKPIPESARAEAARGLQQWGDSIRAMQKQSLEERIEDAHEFNPLWSSEEIIPWAEAQGQFRAEIFSPTIEELTRDWGEMVTELNGPTLLITGEPARGSMVTAEIAQQVLQHWPNGKHVHITGAGHSIRRDQYQAYMTAVSQFLTEH